MVPQTTRRIAMMWQRYRKAAGSHTNWYAWFDYTRRNHQRNTLCKTCRERTYPNRRMPKAEKNINIEPTQNSPQIAHTPLLILAEQTKTQSALKCPDVTLNAVSQLWCESNSYCDVVSRWFLYPRCSRFRQQPTELLQNTPFVGLLPNWDNG
jgi:hypothetical protein